ncbi:MAG: alpha-2-macroglobulin family protein, partial [Phycisphaerae bacterium]
MKISGRWEPNAQFFRDFKLCSAGIDGEWGSDDDVTADRSMPVLAQAGAMNGRGGRWALGAVRGGAARFLAREGAPVPMAPMAKGMAMKTGMARQGGAAEPPRIRRHFPETLYFNPAVITDPRGLANIEIPLADSITTWRLTCMGSAAGGELGSTTSGIRVFQDFFVDVDFPVSLTQNDEVHVPVVVYNYLKSDQLVRLKVTKEDWFELKGDEEVTLKLAPSEVRSVQFPIVARKVGVQTFTVFGYGAKKSDAVARTVEIAPDGKEFVVSHSGRLKGAIRHDVNIPKGAIEGASTIFVKVYPGTLSQVVEGLDKMLRMPFGCFEQTSSVTYPNVLVMDYMKATGKITPEVQMKAQGFINAGYQRLVSFEVAGGGFEWFGRAPAHRILTAFGLMEFHDMSKVHEVDPAIIARTQQWLAKCQEADGSYKPSKGGIAEGAINKFTDDVFRNTAYITWALASTGYQGGQVAKGLAYLRDHLDDMKDTYTIALVANTFAAVDPKSKPTAAVLQVLYDKRTEEGDMIHWKATSETPTHGGGDVGDIEVTALAVQAMVHADWKLSEASKAVTYLTKKKDSYGTWHSTQATIQALRAMLMAERGATVKADAAIDVALNGEGLRKLRID